MHERTTVGTVTPEELKTSIAAALSHVYPQAADQSAPPIVVERPKNRDHGDWASNVALQNAKRLGTTPRALAEKIANELHEHPGITAVEVAGPGFLNITLGAGAAGQVAWDIVQAGSAYGSGKSLAGTSLNLEFVSANPTGPLHIGHTRWAALGDAMSRVLRFAGAEVVSEYYINDAGSQMDVFTASVVARMLGREVEEGGYPGAYIHDIAQQIVNDHPDYSAALRQAEVDQAEERQDDASAPPALAQASVPSHIWDGIKEAAYALQLRDIQQTLTDFGVSFDVWFSERELHASGAVQQAVTRLREAGHVYDREGAIWLRTTDFGDDKDRVLIRQDGEPTYFAADAAYYLNKKDRGFAHKIYLLGADHHGYIGRLKALSAAAGDDPETSLEVLIGQLISINGAKLSKRAGNIIELRDMIQWLGTDAVRYSLARSPADSPLTLDPEVLRSASNDNPVYYVQYAHARACAVERRAATVDIASAQFEASTLHHPTETALLVALADFPRIVEYAATLREPHRVARYIEDTAGLFHKWYDSCRVTPVGEEPVTSVHSSRLVLAQATRTVLSNGLGLLGVSAPEKM